MLEVFSSSQRSLKTNQILYKNIACPRTWISRRGYYKDAPSNHIISSKVAAFMALDVLLFTVVYTLILKHPWPEATAFLPNFIFCKFVVSITYYHENIRPYALTCQPFKALTQTWALRRVRQVNSCHEFSSA